jgi:hypothetical protein
MKIKSLCVGIFVIFAFLSEQSRATDNEWSSYFTNYLPRLDKLIPAAFSCGDSTHDERLPDCFIRTNYSPQKYAIDTGVFSDFDLSEENIANMQSLWYQLQSVTTEANANLLKQYITNLERQLKENGYESDITLSKDQLIMDSYCFLAKNGYAPAFGQLYDIFGKDIYGQKKNRKLEKLFREYALEVGTIDKIIKAKKSSEAIMARRAAARQSAEPQKANERPSTPPTARNSDESFEDSKTVAGISQKIRKKID